MLCRPLVLALTLLAGACGGTSGRDAARIAGISQRLEDGSMVDASWMAPLVTAKIPESAALAGVGVSMWFEERRSAEVGRELFLQAEIDAPTGLRGRLGARLSASVLLEREDEASLAEDVTIAAGRALAVLEARLLLAQDDEAAARRLLADEDAELVILALEWVRERAPVSFAPATAALVSHEDERVAGLAIECLGYAEDPSYARLIIRQAQLIRRGPTREAYRALARLGGHEALGFLRFAAANEDDSILREEAERALRAALVGDPWRRSSPQETATRLARGHR
jgi:hypothetical protein